MQHPGKPETQVTPQISEEKCPGKPEQLFFPKLLLLPDKDVKFLLKTQTWLSVTAVISAWVLIAFV